jgi:hypothetical protein
MTDSKSPLKKTEVKGLWLEFLNLQEEIVGERSEIFHASNYRSCGLHAFSWNCT